MRQRLISRKRTSRQQPFHPVITLDRSGNSPFIGLVRSWEHELPPYPTSGDAESSRRCKHVHFMISQRIAAKTFVSSVTISLTACFRCTPFPGKARPGMPQPDANAVYGHDPRTRAELGTQRADMRVDRPAGHWRGVLPDLGHDATTGKDRPRIGGRQHEQVELLAGERTQPLTQPHLAGGEV